MKNTVFIWPDSEIPNCPTKNSHNQHRSHRTKREITIAQLTEQEAQPHSQKQNDSGILTQYANKEIHNREYLYKNRRPLTDRKFS